ncbi:hypothetical protein Y032_0348g3180 [Ancylostoma ceylanicum]|uniref:G-protein coupled receptors family 3 profile domain-containing protein n=1 Tax=Ancylostoma ceylanicum TaxID=53326 RepID=A0A016RX09_9BILA|nr:hypothetical protein Y032_0348g3180 [Ancylostoma ceylanicum]
MHATPTLSIVDGTGNLYGILRCTWTVHGGLRVLAKTCCGKGEDSALCRTDPDRNRPMLLVANAACAVACLALIPVVCRARRRGQEARGWALMELFLIGASILYMILLIDWFAPPEAGCCVAVWLRQIGFSTFYGSIVLKIYRNLQEYRVRKAQHVSVREKDMVKYLVGMLALTITAGQGFMKRQSHKPTMASVIGYPIDYVTMRGAGRKTWFAHLVSLGFAFMNPSQVDQDKPMRTVH